MDSSLRCGRGYRSRVRLERDHVGHASGFSVDEDPAGGFGWSAFGPHGVRQGRSETRSEAEAAARSAEREPSALGGTGKRELSTELT